MTVWLLYDYGALVGVYADAETAETDRQVLLAQARADLPGREERQYGERVAVIEVTPRTEPRYGPDNPTLSPEDAAYVDEHGGIERRSHRAKEGRH